MTLGEFMQRVLHPTKFDNNDYLFRSPGSYKDNDSDDQDTGPSSFNVQGNDDAKSETKRLWRRLEF